MKQIKESLKRYVEHHISPGSFLRAVLENDLMEAMGRADYENSQILKEICQYVYSEIPLVCWGSKEKVENWLKNK